MVADCLVWYGDGFIIPEVLFCELIPFVAVDIVESCEVNIESSDAIFGVTGFEFVGPFVLYEGCW